MKYPRTCPLYFCDDCGKYTESFMAHLGFNRCAANPPIRLPADHAAKGRLAEPARPRPASSGVKAARRVGVTLAKVPARPLIEEAGPTVSEAAVRLGVPGRSLYRWLKSGIPWDTADRLAVRYGVHPAEIWPTWYETEEAG